MTRQTGLQAVLSERPDLFTFKTTDRGHQLICLNNGTLAAIADGAGASAELGQLALDAVAAADGEERPAKAPRTWVSQPCAPQGSAKGVGKATGKDGKGSPAPAILNGEGHVFEGGIWTGGCAIRGVCQRLCASGFVLDCRPCPALGGRSSDGSAAACAAATLVAAREHPVQTQFSAGPESPAARAMPPPGRFEGFPTFELFEKSFNVTNETFFQTEIPDAFQFPLAAKLLAMSNTVDVIVAAHGAVKQDGEKGDPRLCAATRRWPSPPTCPSSPPTASSMPRPWRRRPPRR
ncbi:unnamed protein product [Prorocentrum cordatum]|uniref:Protein phosphatase n=1 Tax=Prorocentrum cordatum TaxID=2364126 RepID=A0ABN9SRA4_9DINO|nr:unnamed protein product [Polarella glacialis]